MQAKLVLIVFAVLLPLALFGWLSSHSPDLLSPSKQNSGMKRMLVGTVPITVEVAETVVAQTRGLSGRDALPENTGLLFSFSEDETHGIWMKDMRFPIDIVWAGSDGTIVHLESAVSPDTYPRVFAPNEPSRYVLELPAGFLDVHDIAVGDKLSVPLDL